MLIFRPRRCGSEPFDCRTFFKRDQRTHIGAAARARARDSFAQGHRVITAEKRRTRESGSNFLMPGGASACLPPAALRLRLATPLCWSLFFCLAPPLCLSAAPFTPGSLAAFRVSAAARFGDSVAGFIDEITPAGALLQTLPLPATVSFSSLDAGAAQLSRSQDNQTLLVGGFLAPPGTPRVDASNATLVRRVVVAVSASGAIDAASWVLPPHAFSGDGAAGLGGVRAACARALPEGVFVAGVGAEPGGARALLLRADGAALRLVPGSYLGCSVASDRLLAVAAARGVAALEDRHSAEPGLPGEVDDEAFPPAARAVTDGLNDEGATAHALSGAGDGALWLARATLKGGCAVSRWAFADATPPDFVEESGYLSAGNDLLFARMTWFEARGWCLRNATCTGFTLFWNASDPQYGPFSRSRAAWLYLKGPFFYDNARPAGAAVWLTFAKSALFARAPPPSPGPSSRTPTPHP
jgi:hypothetical protein